MASKINFATLKSQTMISGEDAPVTVDTRALIDKVLARYSSDWTTLRELIQNAADAGASKVSIKFETDPSILVPAPHDADEFTRLKHVISNHVVRRLVVSNNGTPFSQDDWVRLKSIANGNPDETKIGAFGVGFYSVFADCDEPFVISANKAMAFWWKGSSLLTKFADVPAEQATSDTSFVLEYRQTKSLDEPNANPSPVPDLLSLCQFLSTSLTFVGLSDVELWLDDYRIATFKKQLSPPADVVLPSGIRTSSEEGIMHITGITSQSSQIEAIWRNIIGLPKTQKYQTPELIAAPVRAGVKSFKSFFSKLTIGVSQSEENLVQKRVPEESESQHGNYDGESRGKVFLQMNTINVRTKVKRQFSSELERATKKPPPSKTKITTLTSAFAQTAEAIVASGNTSNLASKLFSSVLPSQHGRIFIGFPTNQTTGMLVHVSAPSLIPTVERESIDLNARYIRTWNKELLQIAGLGFRVAYANKMTSLARQLNPSAKTPISEQLPSIIPDAIHTFQQFTSIESTPSSMVGSIIETAFWDPSNRPAIDIVSNQGILPSHKVRITKERLSFLSSVPVIPEAFTKESELFIEKLFHYGLISQMTIEDVKAGLESRALNETELTEFLEWCKGKLANEQLTLQAIRSFFDVTIAVIDNNNPGGENRSAPFSLSSVRYFHNATIIPHDLPVPDDTIPFSCTKIFSRKDLLNFGWEELHILPWVRFLLSASEKEKFTTDPALATPVLHAISKHWDGLSQPSKAAVVELLGSHPVVPTTVGMRKPGEAYFNSVKVFDDLPMIKLPPTVKDKFLVALGVRKTVGLDLVFSRLNAQGSKTQTQDTHWSHGELIKYFASVAANIPTADLKRLQQTSFCPAKTGDGKPYNGTYKAYRVLDLFAPGQPGIKELCLPIIDLPFEYRANSPEGKFLLSLGLKLHPTAPELIQIMTQSTPRTERYEVALRYFVDNHRLYGYGSLDTSKIRSIAFLPLENSSSSLSTPLQCFGNERARCLGFNVVRSDLVPHIGKFGVREHPYITDIVAALLKSPPETEETARTIFAYMATRLPDLESNPHLVAQISASKIIPQKERGGITRYAPNAVFLGQNREYADLIKYVDLGVEGNLFLAKMGCKFEPTSLELAALILRNPIEYYNTVGVEAYIRLLRKFAESEQLLKGNQRLWTALRTSPVLVGFLEKSIGDHKDSEFDEVTTRIPLLVPATDLVNNDNMSHYLLLRDQLVVSPDDDLLEKFYASLGVKTLDEMVTVSPNVGQPLYDQAPAEELRKIIVERCSIFLHDFRDVGKNVIRHDAKWLESQLQVQMVKSVSQQLSLQGSNKKVSEKRSALLQKSPRGGLVLHAVPNPDFYDISRELTPILLHKAKHHDPITLEQILKEPLKRLAKKGYNVERILRRREAAEAAERRRLEELAREEQQKREEARAREQQIREEARAREKSGDLIELADDGHGDKATPAPPRQDDTHNRAPKTPDARMPGAFESPSPESQKKHDEINDLGRRGANNNKLKDFFTRRLGIGQGPDQGHEQPDGPVDPTQSRQQARHNIQEAINQCRSHDKNDMVSQPSITEIEEAKGSYCDSTPAQNLRLWGRTPAVPGQNTGIPIFISKSAGDEKIREYVPQLETFSGVLSNLQKVFQMPYRSLHIFYDDEGSTIAFNAQGALFFNAFWFISNFPDYNTNISSRVAAHESWFMSACHETAHNIVKPHNAAFSYYLQRIALEYMPRLRILLRDVETAVK